MHKQAYIIDVCGVRQTARVWTRVSVHRERMCRSPHGVFSRAVVFGATRAQGMINEIFYSA